jgi:hypothetical protein
MSGLLSVGVDVQDLGVAPIPVVRYQVAALGLAGGAHVRKSPYDPQMLDIKFFDPRGLEVPPDREKAMERLFFMEDFERAPMDGIGTLSFPHAGTDRYRDGLLGSVDRDVVRRAGRGWSSTTPSAPRRRSFLVSRAGSRSSRSRLPGRTKISKTAEEFSARCISRRTSSARSGPISACSSTRGENFLVDEGEILAAA